MAYTNTYQRINWQNLPSEATALNDVNLNKMDAEIYAHGEQFETVDTALGHKVDKESGKGLSAIKTLSISTSANTGTKIAEISYKNQNNLTIGYEIKNGVVVDSALSSSSENPVQNKVVKSAIDAKSTVSISDTLVTGDTIANLTINGTTTAIKAPLVEVDDTPSATSENPLQNKAIYEMLNEILPEETAEGNPIAISDASGLNAKACSVDLLPIQDLHGYDNPWVGGAGINKLAGLKDGTYEGNGAKAVVKNGVATLSGTTTSSGNALIIPLDKEVTLPNEQIYYHCMNSVANSNLGPSIEKSGQASSTSISIALSPANRIFAVDSSRWGVTVDQVRFYIGNGVTLSGTYAPMIMKTNTATDFIPYENICPISGWTELNLTRTGKNIFRHFDPSTIYTRRATLTLNNNIYTMTTSGEDAFAGFIRTGIGESYQTTDGTKQPCSALVGKTLRLVVSDSRLSKNYVTFFDKNSKSCGVSRLPNVNQTFEVPSGAEFFIYRIGDGNSVSGNVYTFTVMTLLVEETDLNYEPSNEKDTEIPLGATYYGGNVDFVSGEVVIDRAVVDLGDLSWGIGNSGQPTQFFYSSALTDYKYINDSTVNYIFEQYRSIPVSQRYIDGTGFINGGKSVVIKDDNYSTKEAFKASVTGYKVCYELATPIELTLTPTEIDLLKGNNVLTTDGNSIKLVYSADIKAFIESQLQNS